MYTLGINAAYHDSAACLVRDGVVVAAAEDERFTHIKHGKRPVPFSAWELPWHAIHYCLKEAGIGLDDLDHVAYSYDPQLLMGQLNGAESVVLPLEPSRGRAPDATSSPWDPLFVSYVVNAPRQLTAGAPHHLSDRFRQAGQEGAYRWHFIEHHMAHEASAFMAAPFGRCAVLTMDGRGERATTSYGVFDGHDYRRIKQIGLPDSLGLLYERVTQHLGFLHSSDEYKVMALASYASLHISTSSARWSLATARAATAWPRWTCKPCLARHACAAKRSRASTSILRGRCSRCLKRPWCAWQPGWPR